MVKYPATLPLLPVPPYMNHFPRVPEQTGVLDTMPHLLGQTTRPRAFFTEITTATKAES